MIDQPGFERLRDDVREYQDLMLTDERPLMRARVAVCAAACDSIRRGVRRRVGWWLVGALGVCASATAAFLLVLQLRSPLEFQVGTTNSGRGGAGRIGLPITTTEGDVPVRFSDGTRVLVRPHGRLTVSELDRDGARLVLDRGRLRADVVHRARARWHIKAGPYQVQVTGTRFELEWTPRSGSDATQGSLLLQMEQGEVVVTGPSLGGGRVLRAGEKLDMQLGAVVASTSPEPQNADVADNGATGPAEVPRPEPGRAAMRPSTAVHHASLPAWRVLAQNGRWTEALAMAEHAGFADLCRKATREELVLLGNTARFSGSEERAVQAFSAVRQRFPRSPEAGFGAYALGRMSFDRRRDYGAAAYWFRTYLAEQPAGELEREASGRLLEALQRSGDGAAARDAARDYLRRHPNGPHSRLARSMLGE